MKHAVAASSLLALAAAVPQGPPGGNWGPGNGGPPGIFANFPSCLDSCWNSVRSSCNSGDWQSCVCDASTISTGNQCIESSSCSDSEKSDSYQAIAQMCANAGATVTAKPEATWSATSGGSNWPSGWTTNSAWSSAVSGWNGAPGWAPSGPNGWGPFGPGGNGHGWGPWNSAGAWTNGPWTSWWGTGACPASTWSGWTNGPWSTDAPWTTWSGCSAKTTATSVVTSTVTAGNGTAYTTTSTAFGIQVAQATNNNGGSGATSTTGSSGAMATNFKLAGSAAGAIGVVAAAVLL